jgi:hypothetical protein
MTAEQKHEPKPGDIADTIEALIDLHYGLDETIEAMKENVKRYRRKQAELDSGKKDEEE